MHSTESREEMLGPHSPASKATFSSKHLSRLGPSHLKSNEATDTSSVGSLLLQECVPLTLPGVWRAVKEQLKMTTDSVHNELNMVYVLLLT